MRLLFSLDKKNYPIGGTVFSRPSVRAIIICSGKTAMVHSIKYNYYKFPGGGIEAGESRTEALIRETREEAGLLLLPESIQEYGYVHRIEKGELEDIFLQENYYYLCEAAPRAVPQRLDGYEAEERFTLEYVTPETAIAVNRDADHGPKDQTMLEREALVLEMLLREGLLPGNC
ncbi:MAG: NUDIX domain-containing protein [Oscillospiraceae bacterium]|mgnify:FL=1|nr:NUDIX domain-containing protein [Oscillospiraceae bacterium]